MDGGVERRAPLGVRYFSFYKITKDNEGNSGPKDVQFSKFKVSAPNMLNSKYNPKCTRPLMGWHTDCRCFEPLH